MQRAYCQGRGNAMNGGCNMMLLLLVVMAVVMCASTAVLATTFKVGDDSGWTLNYNYDTWVSGKTFKEGDTLEFVYGSSHDVVVVNAADYAACSKGSNTALTGGNTMISLTGVGLKYYICSISDHCSQGMKLSVTVVAASTAPTPSTTPTPPSTPPSTNTTTPSTNTTTPSSPTNSSPLFLPPSIFTLFLILGLTLFFFQSS